MAASDDQRNHPVGPGGGALARGSAPAVARAIETAQDRYRGSSWLIRWYLFPGIVLIGALLAILAIGAVILGIAWLPVILVLGLVGTTIAIALLRRRA